jgi:hypothetical protein
MPDESPPQPPPDLFEYLQPIRDGLGLDFVTQAERWLTAGQFIAAGPGLGARVDLRAALDRVDPTRHEFRPEALQLLKWCADSATVDAVVAKLEGLPTYIANGIRDALAGLGAELLAAAKLAPSEVDLSKPEARILKALRKVYPLQMTKTDLAVEASVSERSLRVSKRHEDCLSRLKRFGLVAKSNPRHGVALTDKGKELVDAFLTR